MNGTQVAAPPAADPTFEVGASRPSLGELLRDVGGLALLGAAVFWLPIADGGRAPFATTGSAALGLLALPAAVRGAQLASRFERGLVAAYGVALLVHPLVAGYRDRLATALLSYALVPLVYLAARHVLASRLRVVLLSALPVAGLVVWGLGIPGWLDPPANLFAAWRVVPWHNPSGALTGAYALYALGRLLAPDPGRRVTTALHAVLAVLAGAATWLSGSRGAIALAIGVALVLVAVHARGRSGALRVAGTAVGVAVLVSLLRVTQPVPDVDAEPSGEVSAEDTVLDSQGHVVRPGTAEGNLRARWLHVEAALGMFAEDPITGAGLGSYAREAIDHADPSMNFTSHAHDQPAEVLGEGGLLFGLPFLVGYAAAGLCAGLAVLRRRARGLAAGAGAAATLILTHSLMDLDWFYPALPLLAALMVAVVTDARRSDPPTPRTGRAAFVVAPLALVLAVGITLVAWAGIAHARGELPPLASEAHADRAVEQLLDGAVQDAAASVARARAASPGDADLAVLARIVRATDAGDAASVRQLVSDTDLTPRARTFAVAGLAVLAPDAARQQGQALRADLQQRYHRMLIGPILDDLAVVLEAVSG